MRNPEGNRPYAQVKPWTWRDEIGSTPGLGILRGKGGVIAHLSWAEARRFADRVHDLCDANNEIEPKLPTTIPDQE